MADFGVQADAPSMAKALQAVLDHQAPQGAFQTLVNIPWAFGGIDEDMWTWILCDATTLLYSLLAMGMREDERLKLALDHLAGLFEENGWPCVASPELGKFRGPGRKSDPCPLANVFALKALAQIPELRSGPAAQIGAEMLMRH